MNRITLTLSIAAIAAISAPLSAQGRGRNSQGIPPGQMPPAGMCRIWIDGVPPGHQPRATDCATAQRNVPVNGRVIYGDDRIYGNSNGGKYGRRDGVYDRNGDGVIDSRDRNGTTGCRWYDVNCTNNSASTGGWQRVGQDRNGNAIYERRAVDRNGNTVVERARRDSNGRFVIIGTRRADRNSNHGRYDTRINNRGGDDGDNDRDDDDRFENRSSSRGDTWYDVGNRGGNQSKGKGHKNH